MKPLLPPLPPLPTPPGVRVDPTGLVTVGDRIDCAVAGGAIRVDLWGLVMDGRVSAYVQPADALRFATELSRLARSLSS